MTPLYERSGAGMTELLPSPRPRCSLLAVDDEPAILALLQSHLDVDFEVFTAETAQHARDILSSRPIDVIVTDLSLGLESGLELLEWARTRFPKTARVLVSGMARLQDAADAINCTRIHRLILKPWRGDALIAHLKDVAHGVLIERNHDQLVEQLKVLNTDLERRVADRTRELQSKNLILERMALSDTLTGLPNRRSIETIARQELLRRSRSPSPIAFGMLDADRFKAINTKFLHSGGDFVLFKLAQVFQQTLRGTDAIGRIGGEEFLVVAPETDSSGAAALAERLRAAVEECRIEFEGQWIPVTISAGFAVSEMHGVASFEKLRTKAALALSQAKASGRNCCVVLDCAVESDRKLEPVA